MGAFRLAASSGIATPMMVVSSKGRQIPAMSAQRTNPCSRVNLEDILVESVSLSIITISHGNFLIIG
ncbi:hypothetical protein D8B22_12470 [Verminephrobacter aporrectodeae subsp. tuberculatae]|nr:hypothetical protein [Verminephrobacter aporrectodeae subsp. tuberculatae]MCW8169902.1 hypothetical protein [Verminephrobacter aporrectodeae subsp. tuberculatae]